MSRIDDLSNSVFYVLTRQGDIEAKLEALKRVLVEKGLVTDAEFQALTAEAAQQRRELAEQVARADRMKSARGKPEGDPH